MLVDKCQHWLDLEKGRLTSPKFPKNYVDSDLCEWVISSEDSYIIILEFHTFDVCIQNFFFNYKLCSAIFLQLEEGYDFLTVYNGKSQESEMLESLTGHLNIDPIVSTGNNIFIKFETNDSGNKKGFNVTINTMKKDPICQPFLDLNNLKLRSPDIDKEDFICNWLITAQTQQMGAYVQLKFTNIIVSLKFISMINEMPPRL